MIIKNIIMLLFFCSFSAYGALELCCDFERKASSKTTDLGGMVGSFKIDPGPQYSDDVPSGIAARSRQSLDLGNGFVWFRDSPELADNWSINCFVKPHSGNKGLRTLVYRPGGWMFQYNLARGTVDLTQNGVAANSAVFKVAVTEDKWRMWTLVKTGCQVRFYLDGKLQGESTLKTLLPTTGQLYIGAASSTGGRPAEALIDDLAIWSHSLSDADIAALYAGAPAIEIIADNVLKRQPTKAFTKDNTEIYRLKNELDATHAVIVSNDDSAGMALAVKVQQTLKRSWGIELPIRRVPDHADGSENLILCGGGMANILSRELSANQQIVPDVLGTEVRILPEALDWKRGVVYLGGRDEAEVMAAAEELTRIYPQPAKLKFTIDLLHKVEVTDPESPVEKTKAHFASHESRKVNLALNKYLLEAFENYRATGDDRHVQSFSEILGLLCEITPKEMAAASCAPTFEFHMFPQYLYLIENSPVFSNEDRIKSAELIRSVMEKAMDSWELVAPAKSYAIGKKEYYGNHYIFASRTVSVSARYLLSRYDYDPAKYFLAVGENTFEGVKSCPLSPEDAGGYQYLVYRIFMDYMLSAGKFSAAIMTSPEFNEYLEYAKSTINHLGYTPGYGDAYSTGMRGPFDLLHQVMAVTGDREAKQLLSMIFRGLGASNDNYYATTCQEWGVKPDLPLIDDPRFNGLRVLTVNPVRQKILKLIATKRPKLDKAIFRSSWQPDAEFLAINGLSGSPHGHDDAIGISQYLVGPHLWLLEGDYIRRAVEDHNLVSIVRDGVGLSRQRMRIPDLERFSQVVGQTENAEKTMAVLSLVIEKCNGVDYFRHICWAHGEGFWIIDELQAVEPGDYRFISHWRTTGDLTLHKQGVTAKQLPAPNDGGLSAFSIAEGTGAAQFGYSEFERTHGRGNRSLSYKYSDGVIRTRLYWKDASLTSGGKTFFVQYFRAVSGEKPEPVMVEEVSPGIFAAGSGEGRSTISVVDGIGFSARQGCLTLPADTKSAAITAAEGIVKPNTVPLLPAGAAQSEGTLLAEYGAQISAVASGEKTLAIGLENGQFLLLDRDGKVKATQKFPTEVSAIAVIPTPHGECFAVGCRPVDVSEISAGTIRLIGESGQELWKNEILPFSRRPGTPATIFPAYLAGKDQPPAIIVGVEAQHYYAFDLDGKQILAKQVTHGATVGVAGDFDGDGRDEIYGGVEYYYHLIFDAKGNTLSSTTTSPWDIAAVFGAVPDDGPKRVFVARKDGFLYTESPSASGTNPWSARLAGPAYGLVVLPDAVAAATINGYISLLNGDGKTIGSIKLPAPLTGLAMYRTRLYTPGLDGRVYAVDPAAEKLVGAIDCAHLTGMERFLPKLAVSGDTLFATFGNQVFRIEK